MDAFVTISNRAFIKERMWPHTVLSESSGDTLAFIQLSFIHVLVRWEKC